MTRPEQRRVTALMGGLSALAREHGLPNWFSLQEVQAAVGGGFTALGLGGAYHRNSIHVQDVFECRGMSVEREVMDGRVGFRLLAVAA